MNNNLMYASEEDANFYLKCVSGLPTLAGLNGTGRDANGIPIPYGVGPHSIRCMREIINIVNPKSIFEIGFNIGGSAAIWLELSPHMFLYSCDISKKEETIVAANILTERYRHRFKYQDRTEILIPYPIDMIFIDGGHLFEDVKMDIELAVKMGIKHIVFDDILPQFGPGVMPAIECYPQLELVKELGNIALYKNTGI